MTAIPQELRDKPRWVIWRAEERGGKTTKILYDPKTPTRRGSSTDPGTWSTYDQVIAMKDQAGANGIGFVFNGDGIIGVDFDHVRDPDTGIIEPEALQEITALDSYTEVSPSGTGVHVICTGKIPGDRRRAGAREMYESGRYFTFTRDHVPGTPETVNNAQPGIMGLCAKWFPEKEKRKAAAAAAPGPAATAGQAPAPGMGTGLSSGVSMDDDQIIALAGEAKNGDKFKNLMVGSVTGYPSQSEAESALCAMLAFYTKDADQIDRIYRRSGLARGKWDEMHGGDTYGRITIGNALNLVREKYGARGSAGDRPRILVSDTRLRDISDQSVGYLVESNDPPWLFVRGRDVTRVCMSGGGLPVIEVLDASALRGILERSCDYVRVSSAGKTTPARDFPVPPSWDLVNDILSLPSWPFPVIDAITSTPIIDLNTGGILTGGGYDAKTQIYYYPHDGLIIPPVSENPTAEEVRAAKQILEEPFKDFPLVDNASRTHITAALITAVLRPSLPDIVPITLIDKPTAGTGASLIAKIISVITLGTAAAMVPAPEDNAEWRKLITSMMAKGATLVNVDNVEWKIHAPSLALLATSNYIEDRILGASKTGSWPNRSTWILNGNNITLGGDLPRRVIWARMDALESRPWQRDQEYAHPDVLGWTRDRRGEILGAVLTLARYWIRQGRPRPGADVPKLGGFEKWRDIVGGILTSAGFTGFLGNLEDLYSEMDVDGTQWDGFINAWFEKWGDTPITVTDLISQVKREYDSTDPECARDLKIADHLPDDLTDAMMDRKGSPSKRVGNAIRKRKDRIFSNNLKLSKAGTRHKIATWKVSQKDIQTTFGQNESDVLSPAPKPTKPPTPTSVPVERGVCENTTSDVKGSLGGFTTARGGVLDNTNNVHLPPRTSLSGLQTPQTPPSDVNPKNGNPPFLWNSENPQDPKEYEKSLQSMQQAGTIVDNSDPEKWVDLIKKYDLPIDLDISGHQKFTRAGYFCNCKGCGVSGSLWHGEGATPWSLCDTHYKELLRAWENETRERT